MDEYGFLNDGGETGELIRKYDWEQTTLGKIENWPISLRSTLGIVLHSAFPQCLLWCKDLITFYNDPYRQILGTEGKHPAIGKKAKDLWPEIWDFVGPLIEKVISTGKTVFFEDQLVRFYRNGKLEDGYFTFSYSPAYGDDGKIAGVFVTCPETTTEVIASKNLEAAKDKIEQSQEQLISYFEQSPVAIATISKQNLTFKLVNPFYAEIVGRTREQLIEKPLLEALPELAGQGFDTLLNQVIDTGIAYIANEVAVKIKRDGILQIINVNLTYQPQRNSAWEVIGVLVVATDVTQQVQSRKKIEESEARFRTLVEEAPFASCVFTGRELRITLANELMLQSWGKTNAVIGKTLREAMPELEGQPFFELLDQVFTTGETYQNPEAPAYVELDGKIVTYYFNYTLKALRNKAGEVYAILNTNANITEEVLARKKIEESEAHLQLTRDAVPAMIFYLDKEQRYRSYNGAFMQWFNVNATDALGKTVRDFLGEAAYTKTGPLLQKAYGGERVEYHMHAPQRMAGERWLNIVYTPHKNMDGHVIGVIVHATDITEYTLALQHIEESERRFRNLLQEAPVAATLFRGPQLIIEIANELTLKYWGKNKSIIGKPLAEAAPELEDQQLVALVRQVYEQGGMVSFAEAPIRFMEDGVFKDGFYSFSMKALYDSNGKVESVLSTGIDVTEQVNVRKQIEQSEKELRELIAASPIGICVLNTPEARIEEVNERFILISGKKPEQFVNATYWQVFPEVAGAFAPVLDNVFKTGIKYSTAEAELVLIRKGIPETMFATFEYLPVFDANNVVTKVLVMVLEVTHQVETRKKIEAAVVERTAELRDSNLRLKRSNEELEQFAYIASHDLQEPVRKISNFTQMLEHSIPAISTASKDYITKIYNSADRMSKLVRDVLAYSRIKDESDEFEQVDLNKIVETVKTDFELTIADTHAKIDVEHLPTVAAISGQMIQLFGNLMSNALKYRKPGVEPVITITASVTKPEKVMGQLLLDQDRKYYHIQFADNGIGIENEHLEKVFRIFQRLHGRTEYEGTGIGLAICQKIVHNHGGHLSAAVGENGGALFNILLPATGNHFD